jgi:hypothetical protein
LIGWQEGSIYERFDREQVREREEEDEGGGPGLAGRGRDEPITRERKEFLLSPGGKERKSGGVDDDHQAKVDV